MSCRKTHKSFGQRRRSPRISVLDASKENQEPIRTRTSRIKRKFDDSAFTPVSKLAKQVWKGSRDSPGDADDHSTDCVEWRSGHIRENQKRDDHDGKASIIPDKHTLELVLDTLQRRDTYEIFAEPVDPDEVEDYYEIIKEPMDFGTMRAKLHEGMYENLEQFEHDVFLIPENAMHFNSSATIYCRQARALHELANKVFHALKTDPENFVSEFSGTRRRSMRKALSDPKDSRFDVSSKLGTLLLSPSTSTCRRASKKNHPPSTGMPGHSYATKLLTGNRDGRLCEVADRRTTYCSSLYDHQGNKTLVLMMNEGEIIRYKDSLMSYVKDLGPTAQMVAKRKLLLGQHESNNGSITQRKPPDDRLVANPLLFRTFRDFAPAGGCNPFLLLQASDNVIDLTEEEEEEEDHANGRKRGGKEKTDDHDCGTSTPAAGGGKEKIDIRPAAAAATLTSRNNRVAKKDVVSSTRNNNPVASSFRSDDNVRPVILALENSHSNASAAEYNKPRNKKSSWLMASPRPRRPPAPSVSHFTFDLPFLKARLDQMNAPSSPFEKGGRGGGGVERGLNCTRYAESASNKVVKPFLYNRQSNPSLDSNLALQL